MRPGTIFLIALYGALACLSGCGISQDPQTTVTIVIAGIDNDDARDEVREVLQGMTDGASHFMTTHSMGDEMTVRLSPVRDVEAFSKKINFGEVTAIEGRTVMVEYEP